MKIFNKEEGKEKVYVQLGDIMELIQTNNTIPVSIVDKIFGKEKLIVADEKKDEFVEFNDTEEIEFFKSIEWILDYKKYKNLTQEELKFLFEENIEESNNIIIKYNQLSYEEKINDSNIHERYNTIQLKNEDIKKFYFMKSGEYHPPFPLVPDKDGFSLGYDDKENPYRLSASLDPSKYLLYRTDGKKMEKDENISEDFIHTGLCLDLMSRKDIPKEGDCEISFDLSPDNTYLIINMNIKTKKEQQSLKQEVEKKGIRKILNKIFNKKKKS